MTRSTQFLASIVGLLLIIGPIAGSMGGLGVDEATTTETTNTAGTSTQQTTNTNATVISECQTTIRESGRYVLTENITNSSDACYIRVLAEDVTIEGNGYRIDGEVSLSNTGGHAYPAINVTVKNMTVTHLDAWYGGFNSTIRNVTVKDGSVRLYETEEITITDSRIVNSTGLIFATTGIELRNSTLENTTFTLSYSGLLISNVTGHNTTFQSSSSEADSFSLVVRDSQLETITGLGPNSRITNSTIGPLTITNADNTTIRNTTITGAQTGIMVEQASDLTISNSTITNNTIGIHVQELHNHTTRECVNGEIQTTTQPPKVEIHYNTLANNTIGIQNDDTYRGANTVNATHNYWGASNGPSSATDVALEDPETGTLADGDGASVSEHPDQVGVSNVRFDPGLDTNPTNSTAS